MREFDTIARIGGDKFTILLPLITHPEDATKTVEKVMGVFKKPFIVGNHELHITASIGISLYPDDGENAETLLKNADIAMYYAKDQGRNNYQFFNPVLNIRTLERILLENRLRQAIERGELMVYYQPQMNIRTREIVGAEALVRWQQPELGLLTPVQFIPLAEEIGLIVQIDQWVLRTACAQLKAWQEAGYPLLYVTVNLSARQFQQPNLAETISEVLDETNLNPESLGVEITETLAMQDTELTYRNLNELNTMGIRFSIDDFGTGYSSLSYLKKLPIHKLKIDKSFIMYLVGDPDYQAIINAIIAMAHILKLKVVAEGVETEDQMSFLHSRDCDEMQGYLYSKPVPAEELEELLVSKQ
jgi:EAL domain-containing protein (putative c-di-GMP-specific phosphodiesterase class I)